MSLETCDFGNDFEASYIEISGSIILFLILQTCLFCHTMYYEWKSYKKNSKIKTTKLSIRITFIIMQICGLYFMITDVFRYILDPYYKLVQRDKFSCSLVAYSPKIIVIIYFAFYLFGVLFRLEVSFRNSQLALSKISFIILCIVVLIPATIIPIIYFIFVNKPCIWRWKPSDITVPDDFASCDFHTEAIATMTIGIGILWIVLVNIMYGVIFGVKLSKVLRNSSDFTGSFSLKSLIIKNTTLTTIASISTLFNWFMWIIGAGYGFGISFLYLDIWFNCLMIALMFKYNEKYYKKLCKICIICCLMDCDKTYNKQNKIEVDKQREKMTKYLLMSRTNTQLFTKTELSKTNTEFENNTNKRMMDVHLDINQDNTNSPMQLSRVTSDSAEPSDNI